MEEVLSKVDTILMDSVEHNNKGVNQVLADMYTVLKN